MWKSFDGIASRHIKKRSKGESGKVPKINNNINIAFEINEN